VKFRYAIVLALVALVAVAGFASADRLPQQVPENQIFTIDTLIDVTGAVSQESQMQWTLDSQNLARSKYVAANDTVALAISAISGAANVDNFKKAVAKFTDVKIVVTANDEISVIDVPDYLLDTLIDAKQWPGLTFGDVADKLAAPNYTKSAYTDVGYIHDSKLNPTEEIMILTWTDSLRTNGGKLALNENIDFDSQNKGKGLSNLEVEKVFTYASTEGAHLVGAEEWILDVAGNWEAAADSIRCVFASAKSDYFPAFCNVVKAKSELVNINSAQVSTKGAARSVAATGDIPAMLNYQIAVTPDSNSGSGFADGTVKTFFGGSIMEARAKNQIPSATNNWKDSASVTGGIKNFQKTFNYESGFTF
jgi:hypothetical protein